MADLSSIPESVIKARGAYATVRSWHEDEKKALSMHCGQLSAIASQILRAMQPSEDEAPESVVALLEAGRARIDMIEECTSRINELAKQRAELKSTAWGK